MPRYLVEGQIFFNIQSKYGDPVPKEIETKALLEAEQIINEKGLGELEGCLFATRVHFVSLHSVEEGAQDGKQLPDEG